MNFEKIPQKLKDLNRWVCWTIEERKGRPTKVPKNPKTGGNAQSDNPDTWGSYMSAIDRMLKDNLPGIGFMFNGDGIVGVDIDGCRDPETGEFNDEARDIICAIDSYTEISQSGRGIHIICTGKLPDGKRRKNHVEVYETGRYFIMTGWQVEGTNPGIQERTEALSRVHARYVADSDKEEKKQKRQQQVQYDLSDDVIIEKAMRSKNGDLFTKLMNGSWNGLYSSQSEADLALCNILAFWFGCDAEKMDRFFRMSGLYREKWDEPRPGGTYGSKTIEQAIADCNETYNPESQHSSRHSEEVPEPPDMDLGYDQIYTSEPGELESEKRKRFSLDDIGNAERLIHNFGENLRYCKAYKDWMVWSGCKWEPDDLGVINQRARETARNILHEAANEADDGIRNALIKHARHSSSNNALKAMVEQAKSMPEIAVTPNQFDNKQWLLNVENGVIDLKTGNLTPHSKDDHMTKIVKVNYDPEAKAPTWEKFLNKIFDSNAELISFIKRAVGYSLTGDISEQCFFMLHGNGQNGKSKFIEALSGILGEYAKSADMDSFTERRQVGVTNDIAALQSARLVTTVETQKGVKLNEALVKRLTGGDIIVARKLYGEPFEFVPTFKIWMAVNHLPDIHGTDLGIWRRIRLIPFEVTITDAEKDIHMGEKLRREYPGILRWAVEGCLEWKKNVDNPNNKGGSGLNPPDIVLRATNEYQLDQDLFADFINTCCVTGPEIKTRGEQLYGEYKKYCEECNLKPLSSKRFVSVMREHGYLQKETGGRRYYWLGIGIAVDDEMEDTFKETFWSKKQWVKK